MIDAPKQSHNVAVWISLNKIKKGQTPPETLLYQSDLENCPLKILFVGQELSAAAQQALYDSLVQKVIEGAQTDGLEAAQRLLQPFIPKLQTGAWLNDLIINNFYRGLCAKYSQRKLASLLSLEFFNSDSAENNTKAFEKLLTSLTTRAGRREEYVNLKNADIIFWPINDPLLKHWYLLIIERNLLLPNCFSIRGIDGFNHELAHFKFAEKAEIILRGIHSELSLHITKGSYAVPLQHNIDDCGVVGTYYAQKLCEGEDIGCYAQYADQKCDYQLQRLSIAQLIAPHSPAVFFNYGRDQGNPPPAGGQEPFLQQNAQHSPIRGCHH